MMLRALIFDFNGVIADDEPLHLELFQKVLAEEGLPLSEEDYYCKNCALFCSHHNRHLLIVQLFKDWPM